MTKFDPSVPSVARIYDYFLGGKDNYASDREAANRIAEIKRRGQRSAAEPRIPRPRCPLPRGRGGNPAVPRHRHRHPDRRQHPPGRASLPPPKAGSSTSTTIKSCSPTPARSRQHPPEGKCGYIDSDLRDTGAVITQAAETLDFSKPVAVLFIAILHFVPDQDDPWGITSRLMSAVPPGSYLAVSHATHEGFTDPASKEQLDKIYAETASGGVTHRSKTEIERFFTGLEMTVPGVVKIAEWRPRGGALETRALFYGGVARKNC